jgi:phage terminase small subunit
MPNDEIQQNRTLPTLSPDSIPPSFTPAQTLAMAALLSGKTKTAAAQAAGVSRSTIHEWLSKDPEFMAFFNSCRVEMIESVGQSMIVLSGSAVRAIRVLLTRRKTPDAIKLRAAGEVLKHLDKAVNGPTDVEGAEVAIANRLKEKSTARGRAKIGLSYLDAEHQAIKEVLEARENKPASRP